MEGEVSKGVATFLQANKTLKNPFPCIISFQFLFPSLLLSLISSFPHSIHLKNFHSPQPEPAPSLCLTLAFSGSGLLFILCNLLPFVLILIFLYKYKGGSRIDLACSKSLSFGRSGREMVHANNLMPFVLCSSHLGFLKMELMFHAVSSERC